MADVNEIVPGLWQGAMPETVPDGIEAIVCLVGGSETAFRLPRGAFVHCLYAPIVDGPFRGVGWLDGVVDVILRWRQQGLAVLVCCAAGISRSSLVTAATLMKMHRWSRQQALVQVRGNRPKADPNPYFVEGLGAYERHLGMPDRRVDLLFDCWPRPRAILELGSYEGSLSMLLAERAGRVLGLEGRKDNIERAEIARKAAGRSSVEFRLTNLETDDLASYGRFDVIFHSGVLYHLPKPWESIGRCAAASDRMLLWTHYCADGDAEGDQEGYRGRWYEEHGLADPLSGLSPRSWWMTRPALLRCLASHGYRILELRDDPKHPNGPALTLASERAPNG